MTDVALPNPPSSWDILEGPGEIRAEMRTIDWSSRPVGPPSSWPPALRTALAICLASRFPMILWWGESLTVFYNDAYSPILGRKHPGALGQPGLSLHAWGEEEIRRVIEPMLRGVLERGEATWSDDQLLILERHGFPEETYFTWSYSPIPLASGQIGGVFTAVSETSDRVIGERRLEILRDLSARASTSSSVEEALLEALPVLARARNDLPFALLYRLGDGADEAERVGVLGLPADHVAAPERILVGDTRAPWPLARALLRPVELPLEPGAGLPGDPWPEPCARAVILPLVRTGEGRPYGFLIAGTSPRLPFDAPYRSFLQMAAGHVATAVANARALEDERRRAQALAELDQAKTAFFSNVSHEFRTPLTLMLGPVEDAIEGPEHVLSGEALESVHRNARRLLKLVNALLDFSRIEAGRMRASFQPTDLCRLTADLASVFRSAIEGAGLGFHVDCTPLSAPVHVDEQLWEKIVLNLLSNAFKFTFEGSIAVSLKEDAGSAIFEVKDTGVGIPEHELPHLFERFHRVEGSRARTHEGTGIGLALVAELVQMHGGSIDVESRQGEGTTFRIRLPMGSAHLTPDRDTGQSNRRSRDAAVYVEEARRWLPAPSTPPLIPAAREARVLLVDDNADMRDYVSRLLVEDGFSVEAVGDGATALERALASPPDLVLSDVMMPGLDGFALLSRLRAEPSTRMVPVILLSARAGEEARVEGFEAGADDYLVKPFSARELMARVRSYLELSRLRRTAERERNRLLGLLAQVPAVVNVYRGPNHVFDFIHPATVRTLGDRARPGRPLLEAVPELKDQPFPALLDKVYRSGEPVEGREAPARIIDENGEARERYWDFTFLPVRDHRGEIEGVMTVAIDVTEQVHARDALHEAARRKDEFLAMLAHELRNPLAPVRLAVGLLQRDPALRKAGGRHLDILDRQTANLARLVDDLLDVSRITRGRVELRRERVDLSLIARRAVEATEPQLRQHPLILSLPETPLLVDGDPVRLEQVVVNLLTNAARYTPPGGRIELSTRRSGSEAELTVSDNGAGIPAPLLDRIFNLFEQSERDLHRSQGGLGIGLTIVRGLVEMHGGTVRAESEGPGRGATFRVCLPLLDAGISPSPEPEPAPRPPSPAPALHREVLVVDDNRDAAETLATFIRLFGHRVTLAHDGPEALERAFAQPPDLVLLDIGLPGLDGYAVARRLRADPRTKDAFLVALTGYGQPADRAQALGAGFDDHFVKPIDIDVLERLLSRP